MESFRLHDQVEGGAPDLAVTRRPSIKMANRPNIVVCMPIGPKTSGRIFETPDGQKWMGDAYSAKAMVPARWAFNNMTMVPPLNSVMTYLSKWGMLSGQARQVLTMEALKYGSKYILYWDDDTLPPAMGLYTLHQFMETHPEAGIVSGVYTTRNDPPEPLVYKNHGEGAYWGFMAGPNAVPEEVFAFGAGFMLVRVEAIKKMIELNPDVPIWADEKAVQVGEEGATHRTTWGHDIRFCKLMIEAGYKNYIDGRVVCEHYDLEEDRAYTLPDDSPPMKRGRLEIIQRDFEEKLQPGLQQFIEDGWAITSGQTADGKLAVTLVKG